MRQPGGRKSLIDAEAGSTTVEMAVVLPLFLLLVFGIFEFGRVWLVLNTMNHASREAVRLAVVTPNLQANDPAVINKATSILAAAGITGATVTNSAPGGAPPQASVTITLTYTWMTGVGPLYGFSFSGSIPLASSATMRQEV